MNDSQTTLPNPFETQTTFETGRGEALFYSLPRLKGRVPGEIARLPISLRIVLESLLRNCDGETVREDHVRQLAAWDAEDPANKEIPFTVARVVMQDFTGVPALVDLAAMRSAAIRAGRPANLIQPQVPVDLVIDHSIQVDVFGSPEAMAVNTRLEFERNRERYRFLKWGQQAFDGFNVVPPSIGIIHQVNLEYLARSVIEERGTGPSLCYPDTLVGTDSHTTMINGLGVVGWGVGGIEAEAAVLGQPVTIPMPEVVGFQMEGDLQDGVTATDLVLTVTQILRDHDVVGKFVEFFGSGVTALSLPDRATIANMSPEYGATIGFFPIDDETLSYLRRTGRSREQVELVERYYRAQQLFGVPRAGEIDYSEIVRLDLSEVEPSIAGPKLPQERVNLSGLKNRFRETFAAPTVEGGFGMSPESRETAVAVADPKSKRETDLAHGDVVIAAITSCTNTSNPSVMIGAGLLAKKAVEAGLTVSPIVKTSLAPGSRVVTDYLEKTDLLPYLERLGFSVVGYGCTTCIGNTGPLPESVQQAIAREDLVTASVLSGNRNFEARVHPDVKASFLMSPPLVVAFALAGTVDIDLTTEPVGKDGQGEPVDLQEIWPTQKEIKRTIRESLDPETFRRLYADLANQSDEWNELEAPQGEVYTWDEESTYIQEPPFFTGDFDPYEPPTVENIEGARPLLILGDNVTTDHISPAGRFNPETQAGRYLKERGVEPEDFNSYGSRRGNDRVMARGTFANNRIKNRMVPGTEGGFTIHHPGGEKTTVYEAARRYRREGTPLVVIAGKNYGTGSSRDWAAKGPKLLGVRAVCAVSYERIHRSNLIGMGILPLQFIEHSHFEQLDLQGDEFFDVTGLDDGLQRGARVRMRVRRPDGGEEELPLRVSIETPTELAYYLHGGVLDYVLRQLVAGRA